MYIEQAIEILTDFMNCKEDHEPLDFDNAIGLGIEALKLTLKLQRYGMVHLPFPGETK